MPHLLNKSFKIIRVEGFIALARKAFGYIYSFFERKGERTNHLRMRKINLDSLKDVVVQKPYKVRTFQKGDEEFWIRIMNHLFGQEYKSWHPDIIELVNNKEFDPRSVFFIDYEGQPVGTVCALNSFHEGEKAGFIHMLGVISEHRGKSLGRQLALCALNYFKEKGHKEAYLDTQYHRVAAIKMYRNLGFRPIKGE